MIMRRALGLIHLLPLLVTELLKQFDEICFFIMVFNKAVQRVRGSTWKFRSQEALVRVKDMTRVELLEIWSHRNGAEFQELQDLKLDTLV
jgi:hypothetical protein